MDLLENFINSLYEKINKRSELVLFISDVLSIERESANRRLNGKVQFTIQEMGKLCKKLGISLDYLMNDRNPNVLPSLTTKIPMTGHLDDLIVGMELETRKLETICLESVELGVAFSSIPLEFFLLYPTLEKLMFYKWGYFHVGSSEYDDYSLWEIPERLKKINRHLMRINSKIKNRTYIWNPATVWSLAKEIKYFKSAHAINNKDIDYIKADLHKMLDNIESKAKMCTTQSDKKTEIYISIINHGINLCYFKTENNFYIASDGYFVSLDYYDSHASFSNLQEWITSMKKVSTLISGSGAMERRLFFEEQHNYIKDI